MNLVVIKGNLTRDIELKAAGSSQVGKMSVAINRTFTVNGEKREEVTFVDCEAWGKTAEVMAKYLSKGRPVLIEGRLKQDQWEDKETGKKQSKLKVVVDTFHFVDSKGGGDQQQPATASRPATSGGAVSEDDIPFAPLHPLA